MKEMALGEQKTAVKKQQLARKGSFSTNRANISSPKGHMTIVIKVSSHG